MSAMDNLGEQFPKEQKRAGGEKRGNTEDRRRSRAYLLSPDSGYGGDGNSVPCVHCSTPVTNQTIERDRKIPGSLGGRYTKDNVQPSCRGCNQARGDDMSWTPPGSEPGPVNLDSTGWGSDSYGSEANS